MSIKETCRSSDYRLTNLYVFLASTSGLVVTFGKNLRYLGLDNLKDLRVSRVILSHNPKLCYLDKFRNHFEPPYIKVFRAVNTPSVATCNKQGQVCDKACFPKYGCWGPGPRRCVRCKELRAGDACVSRCEDEEGFFTENNKCRPCHPECRKCRGPSAKDCIGPCRNVKVSAFLRNAALFSVITRIPPFLLSGRSGMCICLSTHFLQCVTRLQVLLSQLQCP